MRRIVTGLLLIFALSLITYLVFATVPADPGNYLTGQRTTPAEVQAADHELGIDRPIYVQYRQFVLRHAARRPRQLLRRRHRRLEIIRTPLPVTASIVFGGAVMLASPPC